MIEVNDMGYMVIMVVMVVMVVCVMGVVVYLFLFDDIANDIIDEDEDGNDDREDPFDLE